jgi:tRNA(Ile)-lysidine synthase
LSPSPALLTTLAADWPPDKWRDVTLLIAVSGGADSVALARGLSQVRAAGEGRLVLAHFNHRLRGVASDGDQAFVEELAVELGVQVVVAARGGEGARGREGEAAIDRSEESLREARYAFLMRAADEVGARYVAMAHTADDQVETVLHNLLRGTGLAGLAGIPRLRQLTGAATLVRPLLGVTRAEILEYLSWLAKPYREDVTNQCLDYTRNRIRHELLPLLEREYNPHVRAAISRVSQLAGEADAVLDHQAGQIAQHAARQVPGGMELECTLLLHESEVLSRYVLIHAWRQQGWPLQDMGFEKWDQLLAYVRAPVSGRTNPPVQTFPGGIRAERDGTLLRLTRLP